MTTVDEAILEPAPSPSGAVHLPAIHINVHVHLVGANRGGGESGGEVAADRGDDRAAMSAVTGRPLLRIAAIGAAALLVGFVGYRAGAGSAPAPSVVTATSALPAAAERTTGAPPTLPEALARELQRPPQIIPPPGTAAGSGSASGPAVFGLHE